MAQFMNFPTSRERVLTGDRTKIGIIPDICLVSHFQVGTWQVLYRPVETGNVKRWGMPLMIPNFLSLKNGIFREKGTSLPTHGFGRNLPWVITETSETTLSLQSKSSNATRHDYPYEFTFTAKIEAGDGMLTYILTMENHSKEAMPIAPGFHPYFAVLQEQKSALLTDGLPGFSVRDFDWIERIPNNPYQFPHIVNVEIPECGTLTIEELPQNGKYSLRNMQIWSEPPTRPDHDFVCFSPTVGSEDALNRPADRLIVEPNSSHIIMLQLRIRL